MPRLITVTASQVELEANRSYLLGRAPHCDVVVTDGSTSRRHARLVVGAIPAVVLIVDLDSRNGTYVNEERIRDRTPLAHGSRIRIGTTVYLLDLEEEPSDELDLLDTGTVAHESLLLGNDVDEKIVRVVQQEGRLSSDFAGQLASLDIMEVLQLLMQASKNGTLHMAPKSGHAKIEIREGEIVSASYQELEGFQALVMVARQKTGIFWLVDNASPCTRTIHEPASRLLYELCRRLDEADHL